MPSVADIMEHLPRSLFHGVSFVRPGQRLRLASMPSNLT